MNFRYEEIQAWIIPGFFFSAVILCMGDYWFGFPIWAGIESLCIGKDNSGNEGKLTAPVANGIAVMLVFLIPVVSLILGWIVNYIGGFLLKKFKFLRVKPISAGYNIIAKNITIKKGDKGDKENTNNTEKSEETISDQDILKLFDKAKHSIELKEIDRFYYRYVFSRNMFAAQVCLTVIWLFGTLFSGNGCKGWVWILWVGMVAVVGFFYLILSRDLTTHSRFIFAQKKKTKD